MKRKKSSRMVTSLAIAGCLVIPTVVSAQSLPSNGTEASKKHVSANTQTPANKRIVL